MLTIPTLLGQENPSVSFTLAPLFEDYGIALAVMGVLVVFSALSLVAGFISALPRLLSSASEQETAAPAPAAALGDDEIPEEILVVIAAAVDEVMHKPHRVVHIRGLTPADHDWQLGGRIQHHQSHGLRNRSRR